MNSVNQVGRLTRDPEVRDLPSSEAARVCEMRIAVDNGRYDPTFVDVVAYGKLGDACAEHLETGRQVAVDGRLDYDEWTTRDGSRRSRHYITARSIDFLAKPRTGSENGEPEAAAVGSVDDDEIDF